MTIKEIREQDITKENINKAVAKIYAMKTFGSAVLRFIINNNRTDDSDIQWACVHAMLTEDRNYNLVLKCCNALRCLSKEEIETVFKYVLSHCKRREDY